MFQGQFMRACGGFVALAAVMVGCTVESDDSLLGVATAAIAVVPADVSCLEITVTGGRVVTLTQDVVPGASTVIEMEGLPTGQVVFDAEAFPVPCAQVTDATVPTWVGVPVTATLTPGVNVNVTLVMTPAGESTVTIDFEDGPTTPPVCSGGIGNCNGINSDGCETNLSTDINNCGACGTVCSAAIGAPSCWAGKCAVPIVASGQVVSKLAVDATSVYWSRDESSGVLLKAPVTGGTATTLATAQAFPSSIGVDGSGLYWVAVGSNAVRRVGLSGGTVTTLVTATGASVLSVFSGNVYYGTSSIVARVPTGGGAATNLANNAIVQRIAADSTGVYFTSTTGGPVSVLRVGTTGGATTTLVSGQTGSGPIALGGNFLFFANNASGSLMRVPKAGGTATEIYSSTIAYTDVAADGTNVYFANGTSGSVMRIAHDGTNGQPLAPGGGDIRSVALDATNVYWGTADGRIVKMSKN
jgi:hypothetical protein